MAEDEMQQIWVLEGIQVHDDQLTCDFWMELSGLNQTEFFTFTSRLDLVFSSFGYLGVDVAIGNKPDCVTMPGQV